MPLNLAAEPVERVPLAGPQVASQAVSATMRRWDARQALLKRQPLVALAFHIIAMHENRADNNLGRFDELTYEAKRALAQEGVDLSLIDELYAPATLTPGLALSDALHRMRGEPCAI
jgi:hypothetical protein